VANCQKTSLLVDSVISGISITNSGSFALQVIGTASTIQVDTTDSGQIFLSKSCSGVEIITAKCSAIDISLPVEGEDMGVFTEKPIPEMFRTVVDGGKLVTNVVEHSVSERNRGGVTAATGVQRRSVSNLYSSQKATSTMSVSCLVLSRVSQMNIGIPRPRGYPRFRGT